MVVGRTLFGFHVKPFPQRVVYGTQKGSFYLDTKGFSNRDSQITPLDTKFSKIVSGLYLTPH
jgi:hypothetical protein